MKICYIMIGIPGSGKSTWLKNNASQNIKICSADNYFCKNGSYDFKVEKLGEAHKESIRLFIESCQSGNDVAVDNTNTTIAEIAPYYAIANAYGYSVKFVRVSCLPEKAAARNVHNVPVSKVLDIAKRLNTLKLPTFWQFETINVNNS